ncbi:hypothetical protein FACS189419_10150 [Planctomycetales bacterium]|nr:hypothetical protein FACS189419_10150 [Planctomycetales bacterium]
MTKQEFIQELEFVLNTKAGTLTETTELATLTGWDSTGLLGIIALLDDMDVSVTVVQLRESKTIADLIRLAGTH